MTKVTLEIHDDVLKTIFKIQNINDSGIDLEVPEGSVLFDNILNLKLIEKEAEKKGILVHFITKDPVGNNLLLMLDEAGESQTGDIADLEELQDAEEETPLPKKSNLKLPTLPSMPKIKINAPSSVKPIAIGLVIAMFLFGGAIYLTKTQKAIATIKVASQPLARSVTIKVSVGDATDPSKNMLKGSNVSTSLESFKEAATTGEKMVGTKAKGELKVLNNTDTEKKFKKGTQFVYTDDKDKEFLYNSTEDVTVPAREEVTNSDPLDTTTTYKKGEEIVSVEAADVGSTYNLAEKETLTIKGQKTSYFTAVVSSEIKGGKSEKVKIVTADDLTKLKNDAQQELNNNIDSEMAKKVGSSQVLIKGSYKTTVTKETYSAKEGDEADKVSVTMGVTAEELTYLKSDLNSLMDSMVVNMVPEGFELSDKDKEIKTEVLGNSTNSELSSTKADLQVTLKTYIVPKIDIEKLKNDLKGKSLAQAERVLGSLANIKGYSLDIKPGIPLFKKVPNNTNQIEINIERE